MPHDSDGARTWVSVGEGKLIFRQRLRLALVNMAVLAVIWTGLSVFVYGLEVRETNAIIDLRLTSLAARVIDRAFTGIGTWVRIGHEPPELDYNLVVWSNNANSFGRIAAYRPIPPALLPSLRAWAYSGLRQNATGATVQSFVAAGIPYRALQLPWPEHPGVLLQVVDNVKDDQSILGGLLRLFLIGGLLGLVLTILGGYYLGTWTLRPLMTARRREQELMSDVSHELRTPLSALTTQVELLLRHPEEPIAANIRWIEAMYGEIKRMSRLVRDLLELTRLEADAERTTFTRISLRDLCETVTTVYQPVIEQQGLQFKLDLPADCAVSGDNMRLQQLLFIFLDNARKYTHEGQITLQVVRQGGFVEIRVRDTGIGMSADLLQKATERFVKGDPSRVGAESTGLGLAIAKRIVRVHQGRLSIQSELGAGTQVTVRLHAVE